MKYLILFICNLYKLCNDNLSDIISFSIMYFLLYDLR